MNKIGDITFESFLLKAVSKAYAKTFPEAGKTNVTRVVANGGLQVYEAANQKQVGDLGAAEVHDLNSFSA